MSPHYLKSFLVLLVLPTIPTRDDESIIKALDLCPPSFAVPISCDTDLCSQTTFLVHVQVVWDKIKKKFGPS